MHAPACRLAWVNLWNLMDLVSYVLSLTIWALHIRLGPLPGSSWFSILLALQHVLLWTKLHYYARWGGCLLRVWVWVGVRVVQGGSGGGANGAAWPDDRRGMRG